MRDVVHDTVSLNGRICKILSCTTLNDDDLNDDDDNNTKDTVYVAVCQKNWSMRRCLAILPAATRACSDGLQEPDELSSVGRSGGKVSGSSGTG